MSVKETVVLVIRIGQLNLVFLLAAYRASLNGREQKSSSCKSSSTWARSRF
jgi:hypothetical protein